MQRLAIAALVLAACGTSVDERPLNLDYITEAIFVPSCGAATCHSAFKGADGFVFDTIEGARATFQNDYNLIGFDEDDPSRTPKLLLNLTIEQAKAPRMPYNAPLPDVDVALIADWLSFGAPGVCNNIGGSVCLGDYTIPCIKEVSTRPGFTEAGAYDLNEIKRANDCHARGLKCVAGECQ